VYGAGDNVVLRERYFERLVRLSPRSPTPSAGLRLSINVYAQVRLKQHDEETLNAFEAAASARPEIVDCFTMSGESDYIIRVIVGSVDEYERLLKSFLLHLPGLASINSSFTLKCIKNTTQIPI
jgi:Lrp/AsnC family transcriptional regulator